MSYKDNGFTSCSACICLYDGKCSATSKTPSFPLPHEISKLVKEGLELRDAEDNAINKVNSKQAGSNFRETYKRCYTLLYITNILLYKHLQDLIFLHYM